MKYSFQLLSSKKGHWVELYSQPKYADVVVAVYGKLCTLSGGWIGGHGMPKKFWHIPVGKPVYDTEDGFLNNSVAEFLCTLEDKVMFWADDKRVPLLKIEVTEDEYTQLSKAYSK